jgi:hypothetical protein
MQLAPATTKAQSVFDDYRANKGSTGAAPRALCEVLSDASENFGGTLQRVEDAGCMADVETQLAKLVLAEAALPGGNVPLTATASDADIEAFVPKLVAAIKGNIPESDDAKTKADIEASIAGYRQAASDLCAVLEDAGEAGGGTMEVQLAGSCMDSARGLLATQLKNATASPEDENTTAPGQ